MDEFLKEWKEFTDAPEFHEDFSEYLDINTFHFTVKDLKKFKSIEAAIIANRLFDLIIFRYNVQYHHGYYWFGASYLDWQKQFPWMSTEQIHIILYGLEQQKFIRTMPNLAFDDSHFWYRIDCGYPPHDGPPNRPAPAMKLTSSNDDVTHRYIPIKI